jgi:hypothetical protein
MSDGEDMLMIPGADDAVIGTVKRCSQDEFVVYDYEKLVASFVRQGMDREEAEEWIDFNISGVWVGSRTPGILVSGSAGDICSAEDSE